MCSRVFGTACIEKLIGNAYLAEQFRKAVQRVMAGESLSKALRTVGAFPAVVIQMIALGEKTGNLIGKIEDLIYLLCRERPGKCNRHPGRRQSASLC